MVEETQTEETQTETVEEVSVIPEYVPEKFWDKDNNEVKIEDLGLSYKALEKKLGSRTEDLSAQIREDIKNESKASVPEDYEISLPELPENVNIDVDAEMPLLQWWKQTAREKGMSQDEFNQGVEAFVNNEIQGLPNVDNEKGLLGENASTRIEAADLWSKKNLSEDTYNTLSSLASTANGVKAIEELMALNKDAPIPNIQTAIEAAPSPDDLRSMMKDVRYWKDGERDPAYVKKVTDMYEKYSRKEQKAS
tara:strand:+ start:7923 stop:8675 length:753 start_codon:yes stop_codon:yes gene_type:complete